MDTLEAAAEEEEQEEGTRPAAMWALPRARARLRALEVEEEVLEVCSIFPCYLKPFR
jgi:hypothetical protein